MCQVILAVILFFIGIIYGEIQMKLSIGWFALISGVIFGVLYTIIGFILGGIAGQVASLESLISSIFVTGGISFAALYAGALISSRRNKDNEHEDEEQPEIEED